ncbi:MAG: metallophosphoesterase family protein [Deltaproteobacteria bacterium]|nr:metallophosphoesterase family protein [Deltaproteobacteria bacterium]
MKIVAFVDCHGHTENYKKVFHAIESADLVLLGGDLTNFGKEREARRVVEPIQERAKRVLAVSGNCDHREVDEYLSEIGINLHGRAAVVDNLLFVGLGGSLPCPGTTPNEYTEEQIESTLSAAVSGVDLNRPLILLSHQPPFNTAIDRIHDGRHVGSQAVRAFVAKHNPLLCISGHIHEAHGVDTVGNTKLVNPAPFMMHSYVFCEVTDSVHVLEMRQVK